MSHIIWMELLMKLRIKSQSKSSDWFVCSPSSSRLCSKTTAEAFSSTPCTSTTSRSSQKFRPYRMRSQTQVYHFCTEKLDRFLNQRSSFLAKKIEFVTSDYSRFVTRTTVKIILRYGTKISSEELGEFKLLFVFYILSN